MYKRYLIKFHFFARYPLEVLKNINQLLFIEHLLHVSYEIIPCEKSYHVRCEIIKLTVVRYEIIKLTTLNLQNTIGEEKLFFPFTS